mgnify:CR=1 FL=1
MKQLFLSSYQFGDGLTHLSILKYHKEQTGHDLYFFCQNDFLKQAAKLAPFLTLVESFPPDIDQVFKFHFDANNKEGLSLSRAFARQTLGYDRDFLPWFNTDFLKTYDSSDRLRGKYVCLCPCSGMKFGKKEWSLKNWQTISNELVTSGYRVISLRSSLDNPYPLENVKEIADHSLIQVASILKEAKSVITVDCGLKYLSCAIGHKYVVELFAENAFEGVKKQIEWSSLKAFERKKDSIIRRNIEDIKPKDVLDRLKLHKIL